MLWEPEHMAYKEKEQKEQRHIAQGTYTQQAYKEKEPRHNVQGTRKEGSLLREGTGGTKSQW